MRLRVTILAAILAALVAVALTNRKEEPLAAPGSPSQLPNALDKVPKDIFSASFFSIGGVGAAGIISKNETLFREFLSKHPADDEVMRLINEGSLPGTTYGLLAMHDLLPEHFALLSKRYLSSRSEVITMSGCSRSTQPLGELCREIAEGKFSLRDKQP